MADALAAVKKDLGKDAVILHTRMYKVGAWFGWGGRAVVEITASDDVRVQARGRAAPATVSASPGSSAGSLAGASAGGASAAMDAVEVKGAPAVPAGGARGVAGRAFRQAYGGPAVSTPAANAASAPVSGGDDRREPEVTTHANNAANRAATSAANSPERAVARAAINASMGSPGASEAGELRAELAAIRRMVGQIMQNSAHGDGDVPSRGPAMRMPEALLKHYVRLIENEVAQEIADELVAQIRDELTPGELGDEGIVRQAVLRRLEALLPVDAGACVPGRSEDGRAMTIALVGPTGVGKTTTIAKLAASYRLRHGKNVALITSDTYRIAAVDQLRTYAHIIGVPLRVVSTPGEMRTACRELASADVILIDTAGRSPSDAARLEELRGFIDACEPHQTHLVLSSAAGEGSIMRTVERFGALNPNLVIFTKLDEAASLGVLVNVASRIGAKLSFVTTGQEVPDDIEAGRADRLARLVLDGRGS